MQSTGVRLQIRLDTRFFSAAQAIYAIAIFIRDNASGKVRMERCPILSYSIAFDEIEVGTTHQWKDGKRALNEKSGHARGHTSEEERAAGR